MRRNQQFKSLCPRFSIRSMIVQFYLDASSFKKYEGNVDIFRPKVLGYAFT